MGYKFNPFVGGLDTVDSPNGVFEAVEINGDITLDDGGTFTTTLQTITPTANRTVSLPNATGTVALVAGSSGQLVYNNAGAQAGVPGSTVGATGNVTLGLNGAASVPPFAVTGSWFAGTTPQVLIQPSNVGTAGAWSASGTGIGVNAVTGFGGNLLDMQVNGTSTFRVGNNGVIYGNASGTQSLVLTGNADFGQVLFGSTAALAGIGNYGTKLRSSLSYSWTSEENATASADLSLFRDAANILAQRRTTNAQTFRVYNTFTDASNYERGFLRWSSNVFEVGPEAAGTGTTRPMRITAATLKLPNLPTYATNAAAITGGLVAGDVYKTATGELRITV